MTDSLARKDRLTDFLNRYTSSRVPGLQYVVVDAKATQFAYTGGWADIQNQTAMTPAATLMAYSMTKTFTAIAILQLVKKRPLDLSDEMDLFLPDTP